MPFNKFGLSKKILKAISDQDYKTPTPIQDKAIPLILNKQDVLGSAQTGTGKTAGFTLPMLQLLTDIAQNVDEANIEANIGSDLESRIWLIQNN